MLTPEEQQYQDQLLGNKAVQTTSKEYNQPPPSDDWKQYAKQVGVPVDNMQQELSDAATQKFTAEGRPAAASSDLGGAIKGVAQGLTDIGQNVVNFGIGIADHIENFAAQHGLGSGDLITENSKVNWSSMVGQPDDAIATRAMRQITKYAAPVVATMGVGGGVAASLGVGAAADLLTLDPHQQRLSTILRDNVPELKNYPVAYKTLDYLSNKPNEGEFEGRFKNSIEGLGIAAPIAGVFSILGKAGRMWSQSKNVAQIGAQDAKAAAGEVAPLATESQLAANESQIGSNAPASGKAPEPLQGDLYDYARTRDVGGNTQFNLNNDNVVEFAAQYAKANPKSPEELFRGPKSFSELDAQAQGVIKDQSKLESLLNWKLGDRPLTDAEVKASQYLMSNTYDTVVEAAVKASTSGKEEDLLHLSNMIDTFKYVDGARTGAGSEAGRALNAHKLSADLQNTSIDAFNANLTAQGRQQLVSDALKASGGTENILDMAKYIKAISELPDANVAKALSGAPKTSGLDKFMNIMQSVAINGMLSSPKTVVANSLANTLTTGTSVLTNYGAAGIGALRGSTDAIRMSDANNYVKGLMSGFFEAANAAGQALKTGAGGPANAIKGDLAMPMSAISAEALGIPVESNVAAKMIGKVVDGTGFAVGLPSRINATADAFWGTAMYRGKVYEQAAGLAERAGLKGSEAAAYIEDKMKNVPINLHEAASDFAKTNTFSKALDPGSFADNVDNMIDSIPMGRVVLPFFKTNANIIEYGFKHSPLALLSTPIRQSIIAGGREGDLALSKVIAGSTFVGAAAYLAQQGLVTGPDTNNPKIKQALTESGIGWQPDSIKVGDNYIGISRLEPFSTMLRLGAVMSQLRNYVDAGEYEQMAAVAGGAAIDFMTPEMMVDGYSRLFDAWNQASKYSEDKGKVANVMAEIGSRFIPFSALQRDIKNSIDPYKGDTAIATKNTGFLDQFTDRLINRYKSISPWHSTDLPIQRNIFGEPLLVPDGVGPDMISPFAITKAGGSEVVQKLQKLAGYKEQVAPSDTELMDLPISMPGRQWSPGGTSASVKINLSPAEYEKYVMYSAGLDPQSGKADGPTLRQSMEEVLKGLKSVDQELSPAEYNKIVGGISKVILQYRQAGQKKMAQDPAIMDRWQKALDAYTKTQTVDAFK
jgi:hypothetical protein